MPAKKPDKRRAGNPETVELRPAVLRCEPRRRPDERSGAQADEGSALEVAFRATSSKSGWPSTLAKVDVDYGPGVGKRPFSIFPWFMVKRRTSRRPTAMHFAAATARKGTIRIGKDEYDALLAARIRAHRPFRPPHDVAAPHAEGPPRRNFDSYGFDAEHADDHAARSATSFIRSPPRRWATS